MIVDKNDPALQNPTKRVGKIYMKDEADKLAREKGWVFKEEIKVEGGWRRVAVSYTHLARLMATMRKCWAP